MPDHFSHDVFLSHSTQDSHVVRAIAEHLKRDGLRVWLDAWEIRPGDSVSAKIEKGLEHSRALVLCLSSAALGSDWPQLEAQTLRFRDPLNKNRRFIPLRLDEAPIRDFLAQFSYLTWREEDDLAYAKLLAACRPPERQPSAEEREEFDSGKITRLEVKDENIVSGVFREDGKLLLAGCGDGTVRIWDTDTGRRMHVLTGHTQVIYGVAWSSDGQLAISASNDKTVRLWNVRLGTCLGVFEGHTDEVKGVALSTNNHLALSGAGDHTARLWDVQTRSSLQVLKGHTETVWTVALSADNHRALTASLDHTIRLWDVKTGLCKRVLEGHTGCLRSLVWSEDELLALSGSDDTTIRLWEVTTGRCLRIFEGHTAMVWCLAWSMDRRFILSGAWDGTFRLWDPVTGRCIKILRYPGAGVRVRGVQWSVDQRRAYLCGDKGWTKVWDLPQDISQLVIDASKPDQVQYTNAKVLLVGESGAGKTGLSKRLATDGWQPSDSTVGAWATQWKLPVAAGDGIEREIWLWDFGGQADQRLIHQLYMDETALAVLVFDGQKEDLFETLGQWDRDLDRASRKAFSKLLVAGRVDAGGLRVSRDQIEAFCKERGFLTLLETSAKTNLGCEDLKEAILAGIRWEDIPWRSSPFLFRQLKEEIIRLKDSGRVLMRFNELRDTLQLSLSGEVGRFTDDELRAVVNLLTGPGVVWELKFGSWVLLQPERINSYAQAVIQTMRSDQYERGCLPEERVLNGDLTYHASIGRLQGDEERFVLLAMHQTLVERGLCLREHTEVGTLLIFPSFYRRERPELEGHPAVLISYRFNGFLDDVYATLVVRLHHTRPFRQDKLWRYAADFKTLTGKQLGIKLTRRAEGAGELEVYFDPTIPVEEMIIFGKYAHEHLLQYAKDVVRLRHYVCSHCGTPVGNREVAMERLEGWLRRLSVDSGLARRVQPRAGNAKPPTIICARCERRVPLWDEMEQSFASEEVQGQVSALQKQSAIVLDAESKERVLVGDVVSTVALAGQICREKSVSDHGIDMEVEFKDDNNEASGEMVLLQLKSGDSHLRRRKRDGAEIFKIQGTRHARYWMGQKFPVMLVIRTSDGEIRWMEVRDWLKRESLDGKTSVRQILFKGERFDVMSVRGWRDSVLRRGSA